MSSSSSSAMSRRRQAAAVVHDNSLVQPSISSTAVAATALASSAGSIKPGQPRVRWMSLSEWADATATDSDATSQADGGKCGDGDDGDDYHVDGDDSNEDEDMGMAADGEGSGVAAAAGSDEADTAQVFVGDSFDPNLYGHTASAVGAKLWVTGGKPKTSRVHNHHPLRVYVLHTGTLPQCTHTMSPPTACVYSTASKRLALLSFHPSDERPMRWEAVTTTGCTLLFASLVMQLHIGLCAVANSCFCVCASQAAGPDDRFGHAACVVRDDSGVPHLYVIGGFNHSYNFGDIHKLNLRQFITMTHAVATCLRV